MRHYSTAKKGFRSNRPKRAYFRQMDDMRENKGEGLCLTQPPSFAPRSPFYERRRKKNDRSAWAAVVFFYRPSQRSGLSFCVS